MENELKNDHALSSFLQGGGEMGELTRQYNWDNTVLGNPSQWPQSLRTTLSILLNSKFPMFLFWGSELICFYNDSYRPSLGNNGKHPHALGKPGAEIWPEIWADIKPLIDQVLAGGEASWSEDQLLPIYRNGKLEDVYWTFSYSPVADETGKPAGVFVTCSETTEKVITVNKLRISDQRFKNFIREASVGIVVLTGKEMVVDVVNEMYGRLIERTAAELYGKPLFSIIPEAEDPFRAMLDNVMLTGESLYLYDYPYFIYSASGEKKEGYVNIVYQPYKEEDGVITGVIALCQDVTAQVKSRKIKEEAEEKARLAIASSDLGTYEINLVTDEMKTSARFNAIWGVDHPIPRTAFASLIHPDDRELRQAAHEESLRTGNLHYEARVLWADKSIRWVRVKGKVLYDVNGNPNNLLGVIQDITEQKLFTEELSKQVQESTEELQSVNEELTATNEELEETNVQLVQTNNELEQFTYAASHDMQEPLRKVQTFANILLEKNKGELSESVQSYLNKINSSVMRMKTIIDDLLHYSHMHKEDQKFVKTDLNTILANVETDLEVVIEQKKARVVREHLPVTAAIQTQMYQLFQNILSNALKFAKPDVEPEITIRAKILSPEEVKERKNLNAGRSYFQISVADNGIGFSQQYSAYVFELFKRLHSKSEYSGTGIGLALCRKIVDNHSGDIYVHSMEGIGTTIYVILPHEV